MATVSVNSFVFKQPVQIGDVLSLYADVVRVGHASITIDVQVYAERGRCPKAANRANIRPVSQGRISVGREGTMGRIRLLAWMALAGLASGCATITGTETQALSLQAVDQEGAAVENATCNLANDKGTWIVRPPATPTVVRSANDLIVRCEAEGQQPGTLRAISRANNGMAGNILFGGAIGALIDHNKGTAYDYPFALRVVFGATRTVDRANDPGNLPAPIPQASSPPPDMDRPRSAESTRAVTLDDLQNLLPK